MTTPLTITVQDVEEAYERIKDEIHVTPCNDIAMLEDNVDAHLYFKLETQQVCKVFKFRGALSLLRTLQPNSTVVISSRGNYAQSVSYAAKLTGLNALCYTPQTTVADKLALTELFGSHIVRKGSDLAETHKLCDQDCQEHPEWIRVRPYFSKEFIAGSATLGKEVLEQVPDVQTIIVPVGGGGLIAGLSMYVKAKNPKVRVIGVCLATNPTAYHLFKKSNETETPKLDEATPIAGCIEGKSPQRQLDQLIQANVDEMVLVTEDEIAQAVARLAIRAKVICEGAGACSYAAILFKKFQFRRNEKICSVLTGGNIQMHILSRCIERNMFITGSRIAFQVLLPYGTNQLANLIHILNQNYVEIVSLVPVPHVDTQANLDRYEIVADIPQVSTIDRLKAVFEDKKWSFTLRRTTFEEED